MGYNKQLGTYGRYYFCLGGVVSNWKRSEYDLTDFSYKERMLFLALNNDETFELRWIDYFSVSCLDAINRGEHLKDLDGETTLEEVDSPDVEKDYLNEQKNLKEDLRIERNIWELLRKKKEQEVNVNACLYGHHE